MSKPFFSIIVPTYNSGRTFSACLQSIVNQSFLDFEILVIDGESSDDTHLIAKHYKEVYPNIRWFSAQDKGIYDAMNKGIELAIGEWLIFVGSDDKISNNSILQHVYSIDKKNVDVLYGNVRVIGNTSWATDGSIYDGEFNLHKLLHKNICHQAIFYHKSCFLAGSNFNIDYRLCSDWDFNLRCWSKKRFLFVDLVIADFCGGGATSNINDRDHNFFRDYPSNVLRYFDKKALRQYFTAKELKKMGIPLKQSIFEKFGTSLIDKTKYLFTRLLQK